MTCRRKVGGVRVRGRENEHEYTVYNLPNMGQFIWCPGRRVGYKNVEKKYCSIHTKPGQWKTDQSHQKKYPFGSHIIASVDNTVSHVDRAISFQAQQ
jgi:hypothetical protein